MMNDNISQSGMEKPIGIALMATLMAFCGMITWSLSAKLDQTVLAIILAFVMSQLALIAPRVAIIVTFVFLAVMGDVRRLMSYYIGPVEYDVLLLIGPLVAGLLMSVAMLRSQLNVKSPTGWWVTILMFLMVLQIFNPAQGGITVGLAGGLFYLVPLAWYWVGQVHGSKKLLHTILFRVVVPVSIAAGLLGTYQVYVDFPDYQYRWLLTQSNVAVFVNGRARPFSFFVSPPEYALYCAIGATILLSGLVLKRFKPVILFAPFLLFCCFMQGGRETLLANGLALVGIWGVRSRNGETRISVPRMVIAGSVIFGGLFATLVWLQDSNLSSAINPMVSYQVSGLLNPGESSASSHAELVYTGILSSIFVNPQGVGLGATTIAGDKMGGPNAFVANTEICVSNMFVSLGPVGGIIYLILLVKVAQSLIKYVRRSDSTEAVAVFGLFICGAGHWLNGGHYSVAALIWLSIGIVDHLNTEWELEHHGEIRPALSPRLVAA